VFKRLLDKRLHVGMKRNSTPPGSKFVGYDSVDNRFLLFGCFHFFSNFCMVSYDRLGWFFVIFSHFNSYGSYLHAKTRKRS